MNSTHHTILKDIKYQPFGGPAGRTYGNGLTRGYNYDLDGRITGISVKDANTVLQSLTYAHNRDDTINDDQGQITTRLLASLRTLWEPL